MIDINSLTLHQDVRNQIKTNILGNLIRIKDCMHMSHEDFKRYLGVTKQTTYNAQRNAKKNMSSQNYLFFLGVLNLMDYYVLSKSHDTKAVQELNEIFYSNLNDINDFHSEIDWMRLLSDRLQVQNFYDWMGLEQNSKEETFTHKWFSLIGTESQVQEELTFEIEELIQRYPIYMTYDFIADRHNEGLLDLIKVLVNHYNKRIYISHALIHTLDRQSFNSFDKVRVERSKELLELVKEWIADGAITFIDTSLDVDDSVKELKIIKEHLLKNKKGVILTATQRLYLGNNKHIEDIMKPFGDARFKKVYCLENAEFSRYKLWSNDLECRSISYGRYFKEENENEDY